MVLVFDCLVSLWLVLFCFVFFGVFVGFCVFCGFFK